ncbi:hypothetical protein BJF79_02930 [Actinomadura sp. CNU-125]|nr:hypothetical protein [Actinomadura sp. CNU-125]OLT14139.1 hypothetical protein BJF79_02930 [Actinomadura sp. CNU-125]
MAAVRGVGAGRPADVRDAAVAEVEQVVDGDAGAEHVVEDDVPAGGGAAAVDEQPRQPPVGEGGLLLVGDRAPGEEQPVDASLPEQVEVAPRAASGGGRTDHQRAAEVRGRGLRTGDDLRVDGVGEVGDVQPDGPGLRRAQAARRDVRPVVEFLEGGVHPGPRLGADVQQGVGVDDARHDRLVDPRLAGDVGERHPAGPRTAAPGRLGHSD